MHHGGAANKKLEKSIIHRIYITNTCRYQVHFISVFDDCGIIKQDPSNHIYTILTMTETLTAAKNFLEIKYAAQGIKTKHPVRVLEILQDRFDIIDEDVLVAGLLHDILEDTDTSEDELRSVFGDRVSGLVLELTHSLFGGNGPTAEDYSTYYSSLSNLSSDAKTIKFADEYSKYEKIMKMLKWMLRKRYETEHSPTTEESIRKLAHSTPSDIPGQIQLEEMIRNCDESLSRISSSITNLSKAS